VFRKSLTPLKRLKPHEKINPSYVYKLSKKIEAEGKLKNALAVDTHTHIILDGVHRFYALKRLGCRKAPVLWVDYTSPQIIVRSWKKGKRVTKQMVIEAGLGKRKLPAKLSKHMVKVDGKLKHISFFEEVNIPLKRLK